ncbi:hypothetical protein HK104_009390 [Borealophlyctis nickersoniae]|nr:hypothetical protein HK104_009390 [Borealophlyctis nickersoniae]
MPKCKAYLALLSSTPTDYSTCTTPIEADDTTYPQETGCEVSGADSDWAACIYDCCDVTLQVGMGVQEFPPTARAKLRGVYNPVTGEMQKRGGGKGVVRRKRSGR